MLEYMINFTIKWSEESFTTLAFALMIGFLPLLFGSKHLYFVIYNTFLYVHKMLMFYVFMIYVF